MTCYKLTCRLWVPALLAIVSCMPSCTVPADVAEQKELLVAASGELYGDFEEPAEQTFRHSMTAVKFVCGSCMKGGTIKRLMLKDINSEGVYDYGTNGWDEVGTPTSFSQTLDKETTGGQSPVRFHTLRTGMRHTVFTRK